MNSLDERLEKSVYSLVISKDILGINGLLFSKTESERLVRTSNDKGMRKVGLNGETPNLMN
ncbi:Hypothetical protein LUCI_2548 [Lucifera butyrica]|uniref:Uncharacterized protein n=1 Tax=Lucifera butyrica TaxID=1351585 RepID=A0A498R726_9FIRM|nr:Hypothetical protein LUCI_2548 [Lucifera butyrica]